MKQLLSNKDQDDQLLFKDNNNKGQHDGLFNRKQQENDGSITVRRINEHSRIVAVDNEQEKTKFHSGKSILTDIFTELVRSKETLLNSEGFIRIKEYTIDGYFCRCHEHNDALADTKIDGHKHLFTYKLEF